jgi:hypothetical protein
VQAFDSTSSYNPTVSRPVPEKEANDSSNDKTVFNPRPSEAKHTAPPDIGEPDPAPPEYEMPNQNQTQFIPQPSKPYAESEEPEEIENDSNISVGAVGDRKKSNRTPLVIGTVILVLALAGGAWWYFGDSTSTSNTQNKKTGVSFIPKKGEASPLSSDDYIELERDIKNSIGNSDKLDQLETELLDLAQNPTNVGNYRPYFLLALNQSVNSKSPRDILESLRESATIAVNNNTESKLLEDMNKEKKTGFEKVSKLRNGKSWNEIINQLENFK